jgi:hypothetical protein
MSNGAPTWASPESVLKLVLQIGVPAAIAIFLVWVMASRLDTRIEAISEAVRESSATMQHASTSMSVFAHEQADIHLRSLQILRQTCLNTAKTPQQVELCR